MSSCNYNTQGSLSCKSAVEGFRPAFIDEDAKQSAWNERSQDGFPMGATEWQEKGKGKQSWLGNAVTKPKAPAKGCAYDVQGNFVCGEK